MKKKKLPKYRIKERTQILGDTRIISTFYPQKLFKLFWIFPMYLTMEDRNGDLEFPNIEMARKHIDIIIDLERADRVIKNVKRYRTYNYGKQDGE
jgi:hypothetical protein